MTTEFSQVLYGDFIPKCPCCGADGENLDQNIWHCLSFPSYRFQVKSVGQAALNQTDKFGKVFRKVLIKAQGDHQ